MLARRRAQGGVGRGGTYVFGEVDAGRGGVRGTGVGERLRERGGRKQVLTMARLPRSAAEASAHVVVQEAENDGRTTTRIRKVEDEERRRELARMLSGRVDEASLAHARELLVGVAGGDGGR